MSRRSASFAAIATVVCLAVTGCQPAKQVGYPAPKTTTTSTTTTVGATTAPATTVPAATGPTTTAASTTSTTGAPTTTAPKSTTTAKPATTTTASAPPTTAPPSGTPPTQTGCGLAAAAFCETGTTPAGGGRSGDLSAAKWSVTRAVGGDLSGSNLMPFPSTPVSACKSGVSKATAGKDILACDAASGHNGQVLTALSAQNYGLLSMRPRQQFDFAGRTGTIAYNVDAVTQGGLSWWTSLFVTDDPTAAASDAKQVLGLLPRNGIGVTFDDPCGTSGTKMSVGNVYAFSNYTETELANTSKACVATQRGSLNHIEVRLSKTSIEVWASDFSTDGGASFPALKKIFSSSANLSFTRGYVHFQQADRAPAKYGTQFGISPGYANNYWSNLGFDGPVLAGERGYSVGDALSTNPNGLGLNVGYALLNNPYSASKCCDSSGDVTVPSFGVSGVDLTGVTSASLAFAVSYTYINEATPSTVGLRYSINGGPWRSPSAQPNYAAEQACSSCPGPTGGGGVLYNFPVAVSELRTGSNTIAFAVDNTVNSWPPILTGLDLLTFR